MWSWRFESIALSVHFIDCVKISLYLQILGNDFYSGSGFFPKRCFNLIWFEQNIPYAISFAFIKKYILYQAHTQREKYIYVYTWITFGHLNHPQSPDCIKTEISIKCSKIQINTFNGLSTGNYSPHLFWNPVEVYAVAGTNAFWQMSYIWMEKKQQFRLTVSNWLIDW